jgi:hypothetical protein
MTTAPNKQSKTARCALIAATEGQPVTLNELAAKAALLKLFRADADAFGAALAPEELRFLYSLAGDAEAIADRARAAQ